MATLRARAARQALEAAVTIRRRALARRARPLSPDDPPERFDKLALAMREGLDGLGRYNRPLAGVRVTTARHAPVKTSWLTPDRDTEGRVLLYLHGGAYVAGSRWTHVGLASALAKAGRCRVALIEYRLAPEHRFPAAVHDAVAAYRWLLESEGVDPTKLVVAGDSAGGGLTFGSMLMAMDVGLPMPAGLIGLSPWTDLTASSPTLQSHDSIDPYLDGTMTAPVARVYAGDDVAHRYASPALADLTGLPPILVHVGSDEILVGDAELLVERARAHGVDASLGLFKGMWHVFQAFAFIPEAQQSLREMGAFVRRVTSDTAIAA